MSNSRTIRFKTTGAYARSSRITNLFKGGMSVMGWAKGSGVTAGAVMNVYGSSDDGTPAGTGQQGNGNAQMNDDQSKQTLICSVHPTTGTAGATGVVDVQANVVCWWDYLYVEILTPEGTTTQLELTISGADRP